MYACIPTYLPTYIHTCIHAHIHTRICTHYLHAYIHAQVHERSLDSDFLLVILRELLASRDDLKVVLMSATLNARAFAQYFESPPPPLALSAPQAPHA